MEYLPDVSHRIYRTPIVSLLFFVGYMWRQYSDKIKYTIPLFVISASILSIAQYLGFAGISMANAEYGSPIRLLIYAISGAYLMLYVSNQLNKISWARQALSYVGKNTLIILMLNFSCIRLTHLLTFYLRCGVSVDHPTAMFSFNTEWYWWIVYTAVMVLLPLVAKWMFDSTKTLLLSKFNK